MILTILGTKIKIIEVKLALSQKLKEKPSTYDTQKAISICNFTTDLHNMIELFFKALLSLLSSLLLSSF